MHSPTPIGRVLPVLAAAALGIAAVPAVAGPTSPGWSAPTAASAAARAADADDGSGLAGGVAGLGPAVAGAALDGIRGREGTILQDLDLRGQVDNNSATNVTSGGNHVGDGAFGSAAGIPTVIQNTGSNVLIQNGMNVYVQFVGPGQ